MQVSQCTTFISHYVSDLGVPEDLLFSPDDFYYDLKDVDIVLDCLLHLRQLVMNDSSFPKRKGRKKRSSSLLQWNAKGSDSQSKNEEPMILSFVKFSVPEVGWVSYTVQH
jgi:hypothetical protein